MRARMHLVGKSLPRIWIMITVLPQVHSILSYFRVSNLRLCVSDRHSPVSHQTMSAYAREKRRHGDGDDNEADTQPSVVTNINSSPSSSSPTILGPMSTPSPPSSPVSFRFLGVDNATTCQSLTFLWNYTGTPTPTNDTRVTLTILTEESYASANRNQTKPIGLRTLQTNASLEVSSFTWSPVNVVSGTYRAMAEISPTDSPPTFSASFGVQNGTDLSCLTANTTTGWPPYAHSTKKPTHIPQHVGTGELVGIILGALAGVAILGAAFLFPRLWRRALPSPKKRRRYILY